VKWQLCTFVVKVTFYVVLYVAVDIVTLSVSCVFVSADARWEIRCGICWASAGSSDPRWVDESRGAFRKMASV